MLFGLESLVNGVKFIMDNSGGQIGDRSLYFGIQPEGLESDSGQVRIQKRRLSSSIRGR
jgi:hypothetical protein